MKFRIGEIRLSFQQKSDASLFDKEVRWSTTCSPLLEAVVWRVKMASQFSLLGPKYRVEGEKEKEELKEVEEVEKEENKEEKEEE